MEENKKLKREKSLKLSQALDEAARLQGFSNYKNYLNELKVNQDQSKYEKVKLFKDITTETDLSKKVPLAISFLQKFKTAHCLYYLMGDLLSVFLRRGVGRHWPMLCRCFIC